MYPGLVSSTLVTACQFPPFATWLWVGYAIVVLVYRTRFSVLWSPAADADTQTTWRYPLESMAIEGSPESRVKTSRSEEHTSELQSRLHLVCRLLLEKKKEQDSYMADGRIEAPH